MQSETGTEEQEASDYRLKCGISAELSVGQWEVGQVGEGTECNVLNLCYNLQSSAC